MNSVKNISEEQRKQMAAQVKAMANGDLPDRKTEPYSKLIKDWPCGCYACSILGGSIMCTDMSKWLFSE